MMRVRIAAVPTSRLTVGTARIALLNYLHARRSGGQLLLRFSDLAPQATADNAAGIEQDLRWLGVDWDGTLRQSEHRDRYAAAAETLKQAGRLYPCFESEAELRAKRDQRIKRGQPAVYDRAMLQLTPAQFAAAQAGGKRPYWRFLLSGRTVEWHDLVLGPREEALRSLSDPVVLLADGQPTRAFAGCVDDLAEGTTDLIRGDTQLPATAVLIDMYETLGGDATRLRFAHLPPLEDAGEKRLARRVDARTLRSLRQDGVEGAALAAYLAHIGTDQPLEEAPLGALAADFDVACFPPRPTPFKAAALLALNRQVLRSLELRRGGHPTTPRRDGCVLAGGARRAGPAERGARLVGRGCRRHRAAGDPRTRVADYRAGAAAAGAVARLGVAGLDRGAGRSNRTQRRGAGAASAAGADRRGRRPGYGGTVAADRPCARGAAATCGGALDTNSAAWRLA